MKPSLVSNKPTAPLAPLLARADIWQAGATQAASDSLTSGHAALDAALHRGGWPRGKLIELLADRYGLGELRLLWPSLALLGKTQSGLVLLIAPPHIPYAPALRPEGIDLSHLIIVQPSQAEDRLWAMEQALRSGACNAVIGWLPHTKIQHKALRRLQLAAQRHEGLCFLFRPASCAQQSSPASLRIELRGQAEGLALQILKQPGGWAGQQVLLPAPLALRQRQLGVTALPFHVRGKTLKPGQAAAVAVKRRSSHLSLVAPDRLPRRRGPVQPAWH